MLKCKWLVAGIFLLLVSCGDKRQEKAAGVLRINLVDEPQTLDPRMGREPQSQMVSRALFEGLTRIGPSGAPELALAKSLEISEDLLTYTFTLRPAFWSNGDRCKASDFVYSYTSSLNPDFPSENAYQLYGIKHAKAVNEGRIPIKNLGVEATNDDTLVIRLEHPIPYFLELLSLPFFAPIHEQTDRANPRWAESVETYVSNGPFLLKDWKHSDEIRLEKNASYWDAASVQLNGVGLVMVDSDAEMKLFEKGALDWMGSPLSRISVDAIPTLKRENRLQSHPCAETVFLRLNTSKPQLASIEVRHALSAAIERELITEHILQGGQTPSLGLTPPTMHLPISSIVIDGNVKKAKELMDQRAEESLSGLSLLYIHSHRSHLVAQAIQQQWRNAFGITIRLEGIERKVYFDKLKNRDYDIALCSWVADFHDPINFLEVFKHKEQSTNNTGWESSEYREGLDLSNSIGDAAKREHLLASCEELLLQAMPIIPLYTNAMLYAKQEGVENVSLTSLGSLDFKWASLDNQNHE